MYIFNYKKEIIKNSDGTKQVTVYLPLINLSIIDNQRRERNFSGILDSGADITILPIELFNNLQIPKIGGNSNEFTPKGIGDNELLIFGKYRAHFSIDCESPNNDSIGLIFWGSTEEKIGKYPIIGRNFMNRFEITFDGKKRQTIIRQYTP